MVERRRGIGTDERSTRAVQAAVDWNLVHGVGFKASEGQMRQVPFSLTPSVIHPLIWSEMNAAVDTMGRLIQAIARDREFLRDAIAPVALSDLFFQRLLQMHDRLHGAEYRPLPVLIMRTDFMEDRTLGPQVVEFNGIAAGMGPFGQRTHELHRYLQSQWPDVVRRWAPAFDGGLVENRAIERLGKGIARAATGIRREFAETGEAVMLMVIQDDEDNVFDQKLLEVELYRRGVKTVRRTFRQLYGRLSTGEGHRLLLEGVGSIDFVYLRAGYQYRDYVANDIRDLPCCEALAQVRVLIERHRVAINATVAQQLATSKRVQLLLSHMAPEALTRFGVSLQEARQLSPMLAAMHPVNAETLGWLAQSDPQHWVLKSQGEGGGHCVFGDEIAPALESLSLSQHPAWSLMRRLRPPARGQSALVVRNGHAQEVSDLISEIGLFTVHIGSERGAEPSGADGYLIRSKPSGVTEGGVHSGLGVLDSLALLSAGSDCR